MQPSESFSFALRDNLIIWHSGEISKANFLDRDEVVQTARLLVRRGEVVCALCSGALTVHGSYRRHCRDEGGERHNGWIAQGHCCACKVYPALTPSFIKPHKHYKADVIEQVVKEAEDGDNFENSGGCAADASTMRRWVGEFKERGEQAVVCLISKLPTAHKAHTDSHNLRNMTLLRQIAWLLREYEYTLPESGGIIGTANIILTTRNCGFL